MSPIAKSVPWDRVVGSHRHGRFYGTSTSGRRATGVEIQCCTTDRTRTGGRGPVGRDRDTQEWDRET